MPLFNKTADNFVEVILENGESFHPKDYYNTVRALFAPALSGNFMWIMVALPGQKLESLGPNPFHVMATGGTRVDVTIGPVAFLEGPLPPGEDEVNWLLQIRADELPGGGIPVQDPQ